ncbi:MAG: T9SS type A sorting domain-containing protein [Chlorobi bacterium]|nr:T9SS type A sorting domain-containing protein [Chlorobiota bacterium]
MKNIFAIVFSLFTLGGLGQGLNGELAFNDSYDQYSMGIVVVDEFSYFVKVQEYSGGFPSSCSLVKVDTLENIVWSSDITPQIAEITEVYEIIPSESGGVYLLGFGIPVCDIGGDCFWFIQKYSKDGSAILTKVWKTTDCFEAQLSGLSLIWDNMVLFNYFTSGGSTIYTMGTEGSILDSISIAKSGLEGIAYFDDYEKLAFKHDSLFGFDMNGEVSFLNGFGSPIMDLKVVNDTMFLLTQDSLFMYNSGFQEILGTEITGYSEYSKLKVSNTSIEILSHGSTEQTVLTLNHQFQLTGISTIPIAVSYGSLNDYSDSHFTATVNFGLAHYSSIRHLDYSRKSGENTTVNTTDIGIVKIQPTEVSAVESSWAQNVYAIKVYADVLVRNFGENILDDCRINHYVQSGVACGNIVYSQHFSDLNLAPGDSAWISLGAVHYEDIYVPEDTIQKEICIYSSHPNFKTDLNISNDMACKNVIFGYVGLESKPFDKMDIFPNPVNGFLIVRWNPHIATNLDFAIFDMQGAIIKKGKIVSNKIDVRILPKGMYILRVLSEDGSYHYNTCFIKQ